MRELYDMDYKFSIIVPAINKPFYGYRRGRNGAITKTNNIKQLLDKFNTENLNIIEINQSYIASDLKRLLCDNFAFGYYAILLHSKDIEDEQTLINELEHKKYFEYTYRFPQIVLKILIKIFGISFVRTILIKLEK